MTYKRGDVVLLEMPFTDGTNRKKRPALVISNDIFLSASNDVIVCAITSQQDALRFPGATAITNFKGAGLLKASVVKASFHTVGRALIERRLGQLHPDDLVRVEAALKSVLF